MAGATIKGVAFQSVADDVQRLRASGAISEDELRAVLKPEDWKHLDEVVVPGLWYPIATYGRFLDLLCRKEGGGRIDYWIERGARAAERMMTQGAYRDFLASADRWGERSGQAMIQLSKALYGFMRWSVGAPGSNGLAELVVDGAGDFPEAARFTAQGFVRVLFTRIENASVEVTSTRPQPDRVVYSVRKV